MISPHWPQGGVFLTIFYNAGGAKSVGNGETGDKVQNLLALWRKNAYNEEKVICKTINSILKNNYRNFEIIVVNDGSTDRTLETIEERFAESK